MSGSRLKAQGAEGGRPRATQTRLRKELDPARARVRVSVRAREYACACVCACVRMCLCVCEMSSPLSTSSPMTFRASGFEGLLPGLWGPGSHTVALEWPGLRRAKGSG